MYSNFVNWFSATPMGSFIVKHVASRLDPVIFKATNGRFTSTGIPTLPMITMTAIGRKSGQPRAVQLVYVDDGDDFLVVASAMGQARHPDWRYNIEANPEVELQARGEVFRARAEVLGDDEKDRFWPRIKQAIPQMNTYEKRTDRKIRVFRLRRLD